MNETMGFGQVREMSTNQLAKWLEPHMDKPPWPGIDDASVRRRACRYLKQSGRWERMGASLSKPPELRPVLHHWLSMGRQSPQETLIREYVEHLDLIALAAWVRHPALHLADVQDLLWLLTEMESWVPVSHRYCAVDLVSSRCAAALAEVLYLLKDQLDTVLVQRLGAAIEARVLRPALDCRSGDVWWTSGMNWNSVCNTNVLSVALYRVGGYELANIVHTLVQRLLYSLEGFSDDGGCLEGPAYWQYGFGHYVDAATMLHHRTGGNLNLMAFSKIERICRFPLVTQIEGDIRAAFCDDGGRGYIAPDLALKINRFHAVPELYRIAARDEDGHLAVAEPRYNGSTPSHMLHSLLFYRGEKAGAPGCSEDGFLPDMGLAKLVNGTKEHRAVLVALAGRNDVPHNHNDIGTFVYYRDGHCWLTDPGGPVYTDKTFGPQRYEILECRTLGHSCPIVNGHEQKPGADYCGAIRVEAADAQGAKRIWIDMRRAYPDPTLETLERTLTLARDGSLRIEDAFVFSVVPRFLQEGFVTHEKVALVKQGNAVRIGGRAGVTLRAVEGCDGTFTVEDRTHETEPRKTPIRRIVFTPAKRSRSMRLAFIVAKGKP